MTLNTVAVSEAGAGSPVAATYENVDPSAENFDTDPAFDFIENVPADWDVTVIPAADIGNYLVSAKRSGDEWYVGAMTDGNARDLTVSFDFLSNQSDGWIVTEYSDSAGSNVDTESTDVAIQEYTISAGEDVPITMAAGGGTAMRIRPSDGSSTADNGIVSGATYKVTNLNSGKALDVEYASTDNGANVHQYEYAGGDNQKWIVTDLGNGYYKLEAVHSGKALDVESASTSDGANVHQWDYVGGENQQWEIDQTADGTYRLAARHSNKTLTVENGSTANGANVEQQTYADRDSQEWVFERL